MRPIELLADPRPSARTPLGTPAAGGMALAGAGIALVSWGLPRRSPLGVAAALGGAALAYRGLAGMSMLERLVGTGSVPFPAVPDGAPIRRPAGGVVRRALTVTRTGDAVEALLGDPAALVAILGQGPAPWTGALPGRTPVEGDALRWRVALPLGRSVEMPLQPGDRAGSSMAWRLAGGLAEGATLRLAWHERSGGRGTEIEASFVPPRDGGDALRLGPARDLVRVALAGILRRIASLVEAGTLPTTEGQSSGRAGEGPRRVPVGTGGAPAAGPAAATTPEVSA